MKFYKSLGSIGPSAHLTPRYCTACIRVSYDGLYYLSIVGLNEPLYSFHLNEPLTPFPFTSIVGLHGDPIHSNEEVERTLHDMGVQIGQTGIDANYDQLTEIADYLLSWKPGWMYNDKIDTGIPGECIVNVDCDLRLVDGEELASRIAQAHSYDLADAYELLEQADENVANYHHNLRQMVIAAMI